jgi:XTP/dITP diphosphohydrolase
MDLVVGTRNTHKLDELTRILSPLIPALVLHPAAAGEAPVEDGETFRDNALIKARAAHQESSLPAIADDSGIEVTALPVFTPLGMPERVMMAITPHWSCTTWPG